MKPLDHPFHFDPSHGYDLASLLAVTVPEPLPDFADFWRRRYAAAMAIEPAYSLAETHQQAGFRVYDIRYQSTGELTIGGWLLEPLQQDVRHCVVVGHGYGGRDEPDYYFGMPNTAYLFPCFRGLSRSRCPQLPDQPHLHVLHKIEDPERYVIGGCVDDLWLAVSVLQKHYPQAAERIGYMGISFGGGIGALALPWDARVKRVHLNVPTFGCQPLRLALTSIGSAASVSDYVKHSGHTPVTLAYYDAAIAARFAGQPAHIAAALFDPMVAPAGQFGIYNAWAGPKHLFVLDAGHFEYPGQPEKEQRLLQELQAFFQAMSD